MNDWSRRAKKELDEFRKTLKDDKRVLKYGTMHIEDAINDLKNWETFALAGRTQKPLLDIMNEPKVTEAININR